MAKRSTQINTAEIRRLLDSRNGPVGKILDQITDEGQKIFRKNAPFSRRPGTVGGPHLRDAFKTKRFQSTARGPRVFVEVSNEAATKFTYVTGGTKAHRIPKTGRTFLAFPWDKIGGEWFRTPSMAWPKGYVEHPGSEPNDFVERSLKEIEAYARRLLS